MRELHLTITCDKCKVVLDEDEAVLITVSTPEEGDFEADFCRACYVEEVSRYRPAPPKKRGRAPQWVPHPCPHCGRKFESKQGLGKHIRSKHEESM